jgi:hypothetical protein
VHVKEEVLGEKDGSDDVSISMNPNQILTNIINPSTNQSINQYALSVKQINDSNNTIHKDRYITDLPHHRR